MPAILLENILPKDSKLIPFNYITESVAECYNEDKYKKFKTYDEFNDVKIEEYFYNKSNQTSEESNDNSFEPNIAGNETNDEVILTTIINKLKVRKNNLKLFIFTVINTTDGSPDKEESGGSKICANSNAVCINNYDIIKEGEYAPYGEDKFNASKLKGSVHQTSLAAGTQAPTNIRNRMLTNNPPSVPYINTSDMKMLYQIMVHDSKVNQDERQYTNHIETFLTKVKTYSFYSTLTSEYFNSEKYEGNIQKCIELLAKLIQEIETNNEATLIGTANFVNLTQIPQSWMNPICEISESPSEISNLYDTVFGISTSGGGVSKPIRTTQRKRLRKSSSFRRR
jgi:hypothetical protein